ncbi:MAG: hypothetical protein ACRC5A_00130 [Enterobacteriaceae bacterium]
MILFSLFCQIAVGQERDKPHHADNKPPSVTDPLTPPPQLTLHNQLSLLVIDDQTSGNHYITTLSSGGGIASGARAPMLFGVRHPAGRNTHPVIWSPHPDLQDVTLIQSVTPASIFSGLADSSGQVSQSELTGTELSAVQPINLLLGEQALSHFISQPVGSSHLLTLREQLQNGGERQTESMVSKQAMLTLRKPAQLHCHDNRVEGVPGKICLLREVNTEAHNLQGSDIYFVLRIRTALPGIRYRVGQQWYPPGTPIPLAEFAQSKAIELFLPQSNSQHHQNLQHSLQHRSLSSFLEAGFYSASRHNKGDRFAIRLGEGKVPAEEGQYQLSRLSLLLIEDQASGNHYLTTLTSSGRNKQSLPVLYGVQQPKGSERPLTWYISQQEQTISEMPQLLPGDLFHPPQPGSTPFANRQSLLLNDSGWSSLLAMSPGENTTWRYQQLPPDQPKVVLSHLIKNGQLTLRRTSPMIYRDESVEGMMGKLCRIREVAWRGEATPQGPVRFVVRSRANLPDARYRVGQRWVPLGDSVSLDEFVGSQGIDFFFRPPGKEYEQEWQQQFSGRTLGESLLMMFFMPSRIQEGDKFVLSNTGLKELGATAGNSVSPPLPFRVGVLPPQNKGCIIQTLDGVKGKVCQLRALSYQGSSSPTDLQLNVQLSPPISDARFRLWQEWHEVGRSIPATELVNSQQMELFIADQPPDPAAPAGSTQTFTGAATMTLYSPGRLGQGDSFTLPLGEVNWEVMGEQPEIKEAGAKVTDPHGLRDKSDSNELKILKTLSGEESRDSVQLHASLSPYYTWNNHTSTNIAFAVSPTDCLHKSVDLNKAALFYRVMGRPEEMIENLTYEPMAQGLYLIHHDHKPTSPQQVTDFRISLPRLAKTVAESGDISSSGGKCIFSFYITGPDPLKPGYTLTDSKKVTVDMGKQD